MCMYTYTHVYTHACMYIHMYIQVHICVYTHTCTHTYICVYFPCGSDGNLPVMWEIPGLGRSPGEGNGYPLQYSCLENSRDRGTWSLHSMDKDSDKTEQQTRTHLLTKVCLIEAVFFFGSYVQRWDLDREEVWELKNLCFWTVVLEKTLESPLDCKIKPVNPKGNQHWTFTEWTDAEAEAPILWLLTEKDAKSRFIGKDPDDGKDRMPKKKRVAEDEMVR